MKTYLLIFALIIPFLNFSQSKSQNGTKDISLLKPQLLQEDFRLLYENLQQNHSRLFGFRTKEEADRDFDKIYNSLIKPMERMSFYRLIAPFVSEFKDGHTSINMDFEDVDLVNYEVSGGRFFPLGVVIIQDKLYCKSNPDPLSKISKGDEITNINGFPVSQLLPELRNLKSSDGKDNANANTQRLFGYILWLKGLEGSDFIVRYKSEGKIREEKLAGVSKDKLLDLIYSSITPTTKLHLYPEFNLAVVEINSYGNVSVTKKFIDSSFQIINNQGIRNVALDLRKNGGGNSSVGDYFLAYLTREPYSVIKRKSWRFGPLVQQFDSTHFISKEKTKALKEYVQEGEIWHSPYNKPIRANVALKDSSLFAPRNLFLFTSPRTYSSAHMTALAVKCGNLGVIIGQPTGERLNLTGESLEYRLPNSGFSVYIPAASYITPCGDGNMVGVPPDFLVSYTLNDLRNDRDPELSFLLNLIQKPLEVKL